MNRTVQFSPEARASLASWYNDFRAGRISRYTYLSGENWIDSVVLPKLQGDFLQFGVPKRQFGVFRITNCRFLSEAISPDWFGKVEATLDELTNVVTITDIIFTQIV